MFQAPDKKTMRVGETELIVEIADTDILRAKGLSGRKNLNENSGMLFVYDKPEIRRFWMNDMYFDLDVLWGYLIIWLWELKKTFFLSKKMAI